MVFNAGGTAGMNDKISGPSQAKHLFHRDGLFYVPG